jgi:DNA-binding response OmpR family regulator
LNFAGPTTTKRVLVVDDRDDVLTSLAGLIAELGYSVDQALGPAVGANLLASNIYDVVLVDVDMPIKPGRELAAETRRGGGLNATTWIVAFTASANRLGGALWPFDAFLPKPVNRHTLKATIEAGFAGKGRHVSRPEAESGVTMQPGSVP